ncbi:MAG: hypothetical protein EOO81_06425 [Oxalobacteraceae bacterium]|nr:MAG: hypothetical protein EOO81_06425 [Oxalobacteraceae bacterium]
MHVFTLALVLALLVACSSPSQSITSTPSQGLEIIRIIDMELATGEHMYILEYRTQHSIKDLTAIAQEADLLWPFLRPKADAAGHVSAGIRAVEQFADGTVQQAQTHTFIWQRGSSGNWQRLRSGA